jgi:hypothetical protein
MFDLNAIAAVETSELHLRNGADDLLFDSDKKPVTVTVYGPGSKPYQDAQAKAQNRAIERLKKKGKLDQSAEDKAQEQAEMLAACTVSFNRFGGADQTGTTSQADFLKVYADPKFGFIAQQVQAHIGDWSHFTQGSATN